MEEILKTQTQTIKILESDTLDSSENKAERFEAYRLWVLSLYKDNLKGVIIGCATFRLNNSNSRLFSSTREEKEQAEFKIKVSNIYLDFAKEVFYCS